jgi:hypothetical protein
MVAAAPMDLVMPAVAENDRTNVQIQSATVDLSSQAQPVPVSVSVPDMCPYCGASLSRGKKHADDCELRLVTGYQGNDSKAKVLQNALKFGQRNSGHSAGVWAAMRWSVLICDEENRVTVRRVVEAARSSANRKKRKT